MFAFSSSFPFDPISCRNVNTTASSQPTRQRTLKKANPLAPHIGEAAMADLSQASAPQDLVEAEAEPEGDFFRFPKLPPIARDRIWKYSIPSGRVVDIVFDEDQDRYFSFHAIIPAILHTSKEARAVGLRFYTLCFSTESHPASIPFDFKVDCLLFDDWLAPCTKAKSDPQPSCASELARVIGSMGLVERQAIHRIALSVEFFISFSSKQFVTGLQLLFNKFPAIDFLVFVVEARDPYSKGHITFLELEALTGPCEGCLTRSNARIALAVEQALAFSGDGTWDMELESQTIHIRLRGLRRAKDFYIIRELRDCLCDTKNKTNAEEYLNDNDEAEETDEEEDEEEEEEEEEDDDEEDAGQLEYRPLLDVFFPRQVPEEFEDENLEKGELEELLADGLQDIAWRSTTRGHSKYTKTQE